MTKVWWLLHLYQRSYHNLSFIRVWPKKTFFVGWSCFKFSNLGLVLCIALKFYTSLKKGLKHKVRSYVSKSYRGITGREEGCVHGVLVKLNFVESFNLFCVPASFWFCITIVNSRAQITNSFKLIVISWRFDARVMIDRWYNLQCNSKLSYF